MENFDANTNCPWLGGGDLMNQALFLVHENAAAGKINGGRLAQIAPLHSEPGPVSAEI